MDFEEDASEGFRGSEKNVIGNLKKGDSYDIVAEFSCCLQLCGLMNWAIYLRLFLSKMSKVPPICFMSFIIKCERREIN